MTERAVLRAAESKACNFCSTVSRPTDQPLTHGYRQTLFAWRAIASSFNAVPLDRNTRPTRLTHPAYYFTRLYAIIIELAPWLWPLTVAEIRLEARAGVEPTDGPFLVHVLDAIIYPDLPEWLVVGISGVVLRDDPGVYLRRYLPRRQDGMW